MLLVPLFIGLFHPMAPKRSYEGFWFFFVVLLLFCGLRFEVGADWRGYENIYDRVFDKDFDEIFQSAEPAFFLLNKASDWFGVGYPGVIFVSSLIFLVGCFTYARKTTNPWLAIAAVMPYLVFIISLSGIRQACAIGLGFYLFSDWARSSLFKKLAIVALAVAFHNSAGVLLVFVIFGMKTNMLVKLGLAAGVAVFLAFGLNVDETEAFGKYKSVYIDENLVSEGAFFHVLLIAFPSALYLLFRKKIERAGLADTNVLLASVLTLCAMPLLPLSSTGIDRLTLYFSFVQMWTYPALLRSGVINQAVLKVGLTVLLLAIFLVYFMFGAHASAYLPYKTIVSGWLV
ncbi:MAG: EpsG family protein [Pseudomonadota bacterium]